jgi:hypothetical protein
MPGAPEESIHVTQDGGIGINVGGLVIVKPLKWHRLARLGDDFGPDLSSEAIASRLRLRAIGC